MSGEPQPVRRRVIVWAARSAALWALAVAGAGWYLNRMAAPEYRIGARSITDADSIGLPLFAFALALGATLLAMTAVLALALVWRRRRDRGPSRRVLPRR